MYVCVEEKIEFFLNYDEWLQQSRNAIMRLEKHFNCYGLHFFANGP